MTVELRALARNLFLGHERVQVPPQLLARVPRHTAANPYGKMIAARERPQVTLEAAQEFHGNSLCLGRHEIAEGHFEVAAQKGSRIRQQRVACACRNDDEVRIDSIFTNREYDALAIGIDLIHARTYHAAARLLGSFQEQPVQHRSRIDDDGVIEREVRSMTLAGN